jgi:FkbM family methyltransferase
LKVFASVTRLLNKIRQVIQVSFTLGDGFKSVSQLLFWGCLKAVYDSKSISPRRPISISYRGHAYPFHFKNFSDFGLAHEILILNSYRIDTNICQDASCIVDLGANSGISALYFKSLFPNSHIICYEPDPHTFSQLCDNTAGMGNISAHQEVVSNEFGVINFLIDPTSNVTSSIIRRNKRQVPVQVNTRCLNSVVERIDRPIDILKIDIEGSEELVFDSFDKFHRINQLIGEIHFDLCNGQKVVDKIQKHFDNFEIHPISDTRCYVIASNPTDRSSFNVRNKVKRTPANHFVNEIV